MRSREVMVVASRRWTVVLLAVAIAAATACGAGSRSDKGGYSTITPQQLQSEMDTGQTLVIVDLRESELYQAGHIPGAKNIPFEQFKERMNELNRDARIVMVCHMGPMGDVSGTLLADGGYSRVSTVSGGMAAWGGRLEK